MMRGYYGYGMMDGRGFFPVLGWIWSLLIWVIIILVIAALIRYLRGEGESPLDALKRRYARGEIDKKEYERLKKDLQD